jgi:hypothetical protein
LDWGAHAARVLVIASPRFTNFPPREIAARAPQSAREGRMRSSEGDSLTTGLNPCFKLSPQRTPFGDCIEKALVFYAAALKAFTSLL